jgi:hypothetical protein
MVYIAGNVRNYWWHMFSRILQVRWLSKIAWFRQYSSSLRVLKGPSCLRNAFIFISKKFFSFKCTFNVSKKLRIGKLPELSLSVAFWQYVQLELMSIFYGSQSTTLITFCCFYDKLFCINCYFLQAISG